MTDFLPDPADLRCFVRSLDLGSFSGAAREQGVVVSVISRAVDRLEQGFGVRLLRRSTHGLSATPEGAELHREARELLGRFDDLSNLLDRGTKRVSGTVRLATSFAFGEELVLPHLGELRQMHPGLRVELVADDRVVDLVADGIDVALRSGVGTSEAVVARDLGSYERRLYAAPSYVAAYGMPRDPFELQRHALITHTTQGSANVWPFRVEGKAMDLRVNGGLAVNTTALSQRMLVRGLGIGMVSEPLAAGAVARGELVEVLAPFASRNKFRVYAVSLPGRYNAARVRAVVGFLEQLARTRWPLVRAPRR